ncbi:MAG: ATP-binding protein, partial [Pirellulales bacterium]|nr:ATP-binding protein [Pirellulales bacterium]
AYAEGVALRMRNGNLEDDQLESIVEHISADAHRAGEVIRRLRQFVRNRETERTAVDVNALVQDVAQFVASDAAQRQIRLQTELSDNLPPALSDAIEFQQVLLNLVRNGFDAMSETPPKDRLLIVRTKKADEMIEITVEDRGHGLSGTASEQVFEAFFTSKEDGLGMGLAISRSIVENHGGRIWATPADNGAIFRFTLPIAENQATAHAG